MQIPLLTGTIPITLVLPMDLHPLISHELGHAHQMAQGERPSHKEYR